MYGLPRLGPARAITDPLSARRSKRLATSPPRPKMRSRLFLLAQPGQPEITKDQSRLTEPGPCCPIPPQHHHHSPPSSAAVHLSPQATHDMPPPPPPPHPSSHEKAPQSSQNCRRAAQPQSRLSSTPDEGAVGPVQRRGQAMLSLPQPNVLSRAIFMAMDNWTTQCMVRL